MSYTKKHLFNKCLIKKGAYEDRIKHKYTFIESKGKFLINYLSLNSHQFDGVVNVIKRSCFNKVDFTNYVDFDLRKYSRITIYKDINVEVVLICWLEGQSSQLHNHSDSRCFYFCIHGELFDEVFNRTGTSMLYMYEKFIHEGFFEELSGQEIFHQITAKDESISLHVYSPPLNNFERIERI